MSKYIDADIVKGLVYRDEPICTDTEADKEYFCEIVDSIPAADVVEVVRCRECVMWDGSFTLNGQKKCRNMTFCTDGDFYCGWGSKE